VEEFARKIRARLMGNLSLCTETASLHETALERAWMWTTRFPCLRGKRQRARCSFYNNGHHRLPILLQLGNGRGFDGLKGRDDFWEWLSSVDMLVNLRSTERESGHLVRLDKDLGDLFAFMDKM